MISNAQALAWVSPSGATLGANGYTFMVLPPYSGALSCRRIPMSKWLNALQPTAIAVRTLRAVHMAL